jgi:LysR family hydrogen peroxide-inducible transcriptional activator
MRLRDFIYANEIAKHKSFSKASAALFISQPALSKAITKLEKELGVEIFTRDNVSVALTDAGRIFLEDAKKILDITAQITKKMAELADAKNTTLRIASSQFYIKYFLPKVMPEFNKIYPNINIEISEGVSSITEKNLLEKQIDLAIIPLPITSTKLSFDVIYKETLQFAFCNTNQRNLDLYYEATKEGSFDLSLFKNEPFILLKKGFKMRNLAETICKEYGFIPRVILETENSDTVNSLISNNYGVSFLPSFITKYDNVKYVDYKSLNSTRLIVAAYNNANSYNKSINLFIKCIKDVLAKNEMF